MKRTLIPVDASLRSYDARAVSDGNATTTGKSDLVQQQFREEADINTIVRRFGLTGELPQGAVQGIFGDFTGISDYESAVERIEQARAGFQAIAPEVRERFRNDPGVFLKYAESLSPQEFERMLEGVPPEDKAGVKQPDGSRGGGVIPPEEVST